MGDNKNFVKDITNIEEDFAQWYTDIVLKAELADYTNVKGFISIRPYGYGIWENIQAYADKRFKEYGVKNVSMPVLIPESLLNKEGIFTEVSKISKNKNRTEDKKKTEAPESNIFKKVFFD